MTKPAAVPAPRSASSRSLGSDGQALLWMLLTGMLYSSLNAILRVMTLRLDALLTLALVYAATLLATLPITVRTGGPRLGSGNIGGLVMRGAVHWLAMMLWLFAVGHITLVETTVINFTTPLFVMLGAALLLNEPLRRDRLVAAGAGFLGVLVVVAPRATGVTGAWSLLMVAAAAVFALSFLMSKRLTLTEAPVSIVFWQALVVTVLSVPAAVWLWQPVPLSMWLAALASGLLAAAGNYTLTRAFSASDISASQPARFVDMVWAGLLGWLVFTDRPAITTLAGGLIILGSTLWLAHRDARRFRKSGSILPSPMPEHR